MVRTTKREVNLKMDRGHDWCNEGRNKRPSIDYSSLWVDLRWLFGWSGSDAPILQRRLLACVTHQPNVVENSHVVALWSTTARKLRWIANFGIAALRVSSVTIDGGRWSAGVEFSWRSTAPRWQEVSEFASEAHIHRGMAAVHRDRDYQDKSCSSRSMTLDS